MESPATTAPPGESVAQQKARLRREKRAAKIQTEGASRLQAITSLNGGSHKSTEPVSASPPAPPAQSSAAPPQPTVSHPDPAEIDISEHRYVPSVQRRAPPSPFAFGNSPSAFNGPSAPPFPPNPAAMDPSQDPMMAMMQQMLGSGAGNPFGGNMPFPGADGASGQPGSMPGGMGGLAQLMQAMQGDSTPVPPASDLSANIWTIIHTAFSLFLSLYILFQAPFTGSKLSRTADVRSGSSDWTVDSTDTADAFKHFFYLFATFEVVLQTTRFFMEKGQLQGSGIMSTISQFLPEPWAGWVRVLGRYAVIWQTVVADAMVVVFVLGTAAWWRGEVIS